MVDCFPTGGLTIVGTCVAGFPGNGPDGNENAVNPGPLKPTDPPCWPVSKKTPPPPRTIVSQPGTLRTTYAAPRRGAKLNHAVCQRGVPCGASAQLLGPVP